MATGWRSNKRLFMARLHTNGSMHHITEKYINFISPASHDKSSMTPCVLCPMFSSMPCIRRMYQDKKVSVHWSAARTKDQPLS